MGTTVRLLAPAGAPLEAVRDGIERARRAPDPLPPRQRVERAERRPAAGRPGVAAAAPRRAAALLGARRTGGLADPTLLGALEDVGYAASRVGSSPPRSATPCAPRRPGPAEPGTRWGEVHDCRVAARRPPPLAAAPRELPRPSPARPARRARPTASTCRERRHDVLAPDPRTQAAGRSAQADAARHLRLDRDRGRRLLARHRRPRRPVLVHELPAASSASTPRGRRLAKAARRLPVAGARPGRCGGWRHDPRPHGLRLVAGIARVRARRPRADHAVRRRRPRDGRPRLSSGRGSRAS